MVCAKMADDLNMSEQNQTKGKNMKAESLIIDLRKQLPWHRRYFSTTMTAMLWAFWVDGWRPDRFDLIGGGLALIGLAVISWGRN